MPLWCPCPDGNGELLMITPIFNRDLPKLYHPGSQRAVWTSLHRRHAHLGVRHPVLAGARDGLCGHVGGLSGTGAGASPGKPVLSS